METFFLLPISKDDLQDLIASTIDDCLRRSTPEVSTDPDRWFDLTQLCQYHPDKPTKPTVYGWVHAGTIPVHKGQKRLRFLKSEIDAWLKEGKKKTLTETASQAEQYITKKKRG